jgi:hypothetical protein
VDLRNLSLQYCGPSNRLWNCGLKKKLRNRNCRSSKLNLRNSATHLLRKLSRQYNTVSDNCRTTTTFNCHTATF